MLFQHGNGRAHVLGEMIFLHARIEALGGVGVAQGIGRSHSPVGTVRNARHFEQRKEALFE